jgi:hypothetical protein
MMTHDIKEGTYFLPYEPCLSLITALQHENREFYVIKMSKPNILIQLHGFKGGLVIE